MRRDITITIAPEADIRKEIAKLSLHFEGQPEEVVLDVNATALLRVSRTVPDLAQDFLCIASCIYAADKAVPRDGADDKWTRHLAIEIPVEHVETWADVADELSDCIGFLTGDRWEISFRHGEKRLVQKKPRRRSVRFKRATGEAVCLFSGGLDSFIGAVDWLTENPTENLLLVGHYDGDVSGPGSDQRALRAICKQKFDGRFDLAQTRVGLSSGGADTNFRSRSLLFVALGYYFAELLGEGTPVLIPENGPIALNFPLTPARRGSCSTRTVHPHFISGLNEILRRVGMLNPVSNPYALKTKGEMVEECRDQAVLSRAYAQKTVPVKLTGGSTNELQVEFDYAKVTFKSEPSGASIRDGKKLHGTTPVSLTLPTGLYQLAVAKEGFVTTNVALSLSANEDRSVELSLLSEAYFTGLERARHFSTGFIVDLNRALDGVNAALEAKPGDEAAVAFKQEIIYQRHLRDAREFRRNGQITRAFDEVESALKLKVNGPDALTLKQDLQKEQQTVAAAQAQARRELPRKAFEDAVQRLPHQDLFPSQDSKLPGQVKVIRDKILAALGRSPAWNITRLDKPDEDISVIHADVKSLGSRQNAVVVVAPTADNEVVVYFKLWTFTLGSNIQIGFSGISDSIFKPLHSSYGTPLNAASVERRRQSEIEQFKKRLELP